jgi:hypothetical protein
MKLRYDPYQIFRYSKTPAGLYARQKWLGETETPQWQSDFQSTVNSLWADQLPDGSWYQSPVETIIHLFGLHLTVRSTSAPIESALSWLLHQIDLQPDGLQVNSQNGITDTALKKIPFIPSRPDMFLTGAALFLATIFGRESDPSVLTLYQWAQNVGTENRGQWFDAAASHNIFRAMVVHPKFSKQTATAMAVERLSELQTSAGGWKKDWPFYQTLNALAHLDFPRVNKQLEKAFARVFKNQNKDGTWSRSSREWNTFLVIHALKNKGLL